MIGGKCEYVQYIYTYIYTVDIIIYVYVFDCVLLYIDRNGQSQSTVFLMLLIMVEDKLSARTIPLVQLLSTQALSLGLAVPTFLDRNGYNFMYPSIRAMSEK